MKIILFAIALITSLAHIKGQKFDSLALTPPMGWNSWNTFARDVNEQQIRETADAMAELGLVEAGYVYLVIDDTWMDTIRDENGKLKGHPERFPGGMKALADYVHDRGLKFGLYSDAGYKTCAGYPASRGREFTDAMTFAEWGVDYLKYDWCHAEDLKTEGAYKTMRDALYAAGRPVVFSICEWGSTEPWKWGKDIGHLWRVTEDIINCWDCEIRYGIEFHSMGFWKIAMMHKNKNIRQYSGPGHWNDYDMLEVGNGFTDAENRSHFALWCMLTSPLMLGNDLRSIDQETLKTITNKEVIAINQDELGAEGFRFSNEHNIETWLKPLSNDEWAMIFVNMNNEPVDLEFDWLKYDMCDFGKKEENHCIDAKKDSYKIRDLFKHKIIGDTSGPLKATIGVHDVLMIKLIPN